MTRPYTLTRGWMGRLLTYLARLDDQPFVWGTRDCGLMVAGAVEAMTGIDPAGDLRGAYSTPRGAALALARLGHRDHIDLAASLWPEIDPSEVTTGHVVAVQGEIDLALGVVTGSTVAVMSPSGLIGLPLVIRDPDSGADTNIALRAWRAVAQ